MTPATRAGGDTVEALSTATLVRQAADGSNLAWDTLVSRYSELLWSVARGFRLGTADAADAVQTTWVRLIEHLDRIEQPDRLPAWLVTTLRHECLRTIRRARREDPRPGEDTALDAADDGPALDARILRAERDSALWRSFSALPERCQTLLRMLMSSPPMSYDEVSDVMGTPVGSIGPTRARCLSKLRALLEESNHPEVADRSRSTEGRRP